MNVLIVYAGKTGTTEKCAKILKALIDDSTLCNLNSETPDLSTYDCIICGGSIRAGVIHKKIKQFIKLNHDVLLKKKCGFFICNCFKKQSEEYLRKNIPKDLLNKASAASSFGGEMVMEHQKGLDKLIIKAVGKNLKGDTSTVAMSICSETIQKFADAIRK